MSKKEKREKDQEKNIPQQETACEEEKMCIRDSDEFMYIPPKEYIVKLLNETHYICLLYTSSRSHSGWHSR